MTSIRKTLVLACAVSVLGLGTALAQTDPNAAPAAPAAGATAAPAAGADAAAPATPATPKKKMSKHVAKKAAKKKTM